jgi:membrane-associated protein
MHDILQFIKNLHDSGHLQEMVRAGGVPLVAAIVFAETGLLVGFFLPGDTLLFVSGVVAATFKSASGDQVVDIYLLVPALIASAVIGDQFGYFLGNKTGHAIFTREEGFFFKRKNAEKAHAFCLKYGVWAVVFAKFAPIFRTFVPFMAGVGEMPYKKYLVVDSIAVCCWICLVVLSGYTLGQTAEKHLGYIVAGIAIVSVMPMAIGITREIIMSLRGKSTT